MTWSAINHLNRGITIMANIVTVSICCYHESVAIVTDFFNCNYNFFCMYQL